MKSRLAEGPAREAGAPARDKEKVSSAFDEK
jgi:hypothetical protein